MKIAIAGYGLEGESNFRYYAVNPDNKITIVDEQQPERPLPVGTPTIIGVNAFSGLDDFDLVVRTAGLNPNKINTSGKIWSATNEFFSKCPAPIIGVTGSKGKGTTSGLIASILEEAGKKVWLVGNIGKPALEVLSDVSSDDFVVYELSSFQLWDVEKSPHVSVVLFIEQEHLDVHKDINEYVNAKANITKYQTPKDTLIFNGGNDYSKCISYVSKAKKLDYINNPKVAHIQQDSFYYDEQLICSVNELQLIGAHNLDNACAAIDAAWEFTQDTDAITRGLKKYQGLPHRLQFVREVGGVKYYDDSIATTPSSAIAALKAFEGSKVIILGGSSKGSDYTKLGEELNLHDARVLLIGDVADTIAAALDKTGFKNYEIIKKPVMAELVRRAQELSQLGGVVLLSPASASFGLFKNYIDRGEQFIDAVNRLSD